MVNKGLIDSFEALINKLEEEKLPFRRVENRQILTVPTRLGEERSVLHIRWEAIPGVIQFIQILPLVVPENRRDDLAVTIGRINASVPILGFTMNPKNGVVAFRTHAFLGKDKAIEPGMIGAVVASCVRTTKLFLPQLREAVEKGEEQFAEIDMGW